MINRINGDYIMEKIKYSIIIPCYNGEKTIERALDSIKEQKVNEYEVLIINDGSTDKSKEIVSKYIESDDRFKLINKENGGQATAVSRGIREAKGEYIVQLDSDDTLKSNALETIDSEIESNDILSFGFDFVDESGKLLSIETHKRLEIKGDDQIHSFLPKIYKDANSFEAFNYLYVYRWACVVRRDIALQIIDEYEKRNFSLYEDMCFVLLICSKAKSIKIIDKSLINYYQIKLTHSRRNENSYESLIDLRLRLRNFLNSYAEYNNINVSCFDTMEFDVSKFYLSRMIRKERYKTCKQLFKKLNKDDLYLKGLSLTKVDGESKSRKIYFFFLKHHMFMPIYFYFKNKI